MVRAESGIAPSHIMYLDVGELVDVGSVDAWGLREEPVAFETVGCALAVWLVVVRVWAVPAVPVASGQLTAGSRTRLHRTRADAVR